MLAQATQPVAAPPLEGLLLLIVGLGVLGMAVILGLLISWRRYNQRLSQLRKDHVPTQLDDAWRAAADRIKTPNEDEDA